MEYQRVKIIIGDREVFNAPLTPLRPSSTGNSVILAQDSGKTFSDSEEFTKLGWSFSMYGVLPKKDA